MTEAQYVWSDMVSSWSKITGDETNVKFVQSIYFVKDGAAFLDSLQSSICNGFQGKIRPVFNFLKVSLIFEN